MLNTGNDIKWVVWVTRNLMFAQLRIDAHLVQNKIYLKKHSVLYRLK